MLMEDMTRYKYFFLVRIAHALSFISICDLFTDASSYYTDRIEKDAYKNTFPRERVYQAVA
jgi:hypothetical protein